MSFKSEMIIESEKNVFCECIGTLSFCITSNLNWFFYNLGYRIAIKPWTTIGIVWLCLAVTTLGLVNLEFAAQSFMTSVKQDSKLAKDTEWFLNTSGQIIRNEEIIIRAPNVLDPKVLHRVALLTHEIMNLTVDYGFVKGIKWRDFCVKIQNLYPYTSGSLNYSLKILNNTPRNHTFEPVVDLDSALFCGLFNQLNLVCYQQNLLALWNYDGAAVQNLTLEAVIAKLNQTTINPTSGHSTDFVKTLGGVRRNEAGVVESATSMLLNFPVNNSIQEIREYEKFGILGNKDWVSEKTHAWESAFNEKVRELKPVLERDIDMTIYYYSASSFCDNNLDMTKRSLSLLFFGGVVMFLFLLIVLSNFDWLSFRLIVGLAGLCSITMGLISGLGIGANFVKFTSSQLSIPFITLGLGVDDIFVIMATLKENLAKYPTAASAHILGLTLKKAGTSITITTLTNVVVFLVGLFAQTPFMVYYCAIAAACIFMTYFYVITFFMAILAIDERRILDRRNFLLPCIRHKTKLRKCSAEGVIEMSMTAKILDWIYGHILLTKIGRVVCIVPAICLVINCVPHFFDVKQTFDLRTFFIRNSLQHTFLTIKTEQYPQLGHQAFIFLGQLNYSAELPKMLEMTENFNKQTDIAYHVKSWVEPFDRFLRTFYGRNARERPLSDQEFKVFLNRFLHSTHGVAYRLFFTFERPLTCADPTSNVKMSMIPFRYRNFNESFKYIEAMDRLAKVLDNGTLTSGYSSVWAKSYYYWIPNGIIVKEIVKNLSLGWIAVAFCTAILIINIQMCYWIQLCVLLTMINVIGFLSRFGISFDQMTCLGLQIAIGLSVDYAVHLGYSFLKFTGTREERAIKAVVNIGPPVFCGALSTLLMLGMLGLMDAYVSQLFLKIFLLVVVFGLYHGLVFLPAVLSLIGPKPYTKAQLGDTETDPPNPNTSRSTITNVELKKVGPINTSQ